MPGLRENNITSDKSNRIFIFKVDNFFKFRFVGLNI